jgi:hypothetical protein
MGPATHFKADVEAHFPPVARAWRHVGVNYHRGEMLAPHALGVYPDPGKRGRGNKSLPEVSVSETEAASQKLLSQARTVGAVGVRLCLPH